MKRPSMLSLKIVSALFVNKKGMTIKDIATYTQTDYKNVYDAVYDLFEQGILKKEKIGNYNICTLNYAHEDIVEYLKEYNFYVKLGVFRKKYPTAYRIITETCEHVKNPLFICVVFGSYARGEEKKSSDIDVLFLASSRSIKPLLDKANASYQKKFHVVEQHITDFSKDLQNKNQLSIATELYKEPPIVMYGDDIFFRIIIEANKW
jgi:predicted nucleotidyltransferase/predicted transcriptional regulator